MKERKQQTEWKFPKRLFGVFLFLFFFIWLQFAYLSLSPNVYSINMDEFASKRNTYSATLYAKRGTIYDSEGNTLALNVSSYTVIAYLSEKRTGSNSKPLHVVDVDLTAKKLSPILHMTEDALKKLLTRDVYQVELGPGGRGITEIVKEEIEALDLPGIDFVENFKRYYPNGDFASYIIGYAKQYEKKYVEDEEEKVEYQIVGELGIESNFEEMLTGQNGFLRYQRDRYGYKIPDTPEIREPAMDGNDIYLTLNSNVQRFVESAVKDTEKEYNPEWMTLTVMDAKTGAILGSSSTPSFDPNLRNIKNYENPLVSYIYEPGSTMKIYTYMCAMESGKYKGNDTFLSGKFKIGDDTVNDWDPRGWGTITFDKGFEYSSNVGASHLVQEVINKSELRDCLERYGFGEKTGIQLPREMIGSLKFTYPIEVATASFGQGITTTAIQQLQALTLLANDGKMVTPYIIDKIINPNTKEVVFESKVDMTEQLVKTSTVDKMKDLMHNVIYGNDAGTTGGAYKIDGFDIIGKTGTAQIYDPKLKKYLTGANDYIYSFAGMYPKDNPEVIIYAAMKKPTYGTSYGLSTAVKTVMKNVSKYLNIFTDQGNHSSVVRYRLDSYMSQSVADVKKKLEENKITPIILGSGTKIIGQYPSADSYVLSHDKVFLITNKNDITWPDLVGWSKKDCETLFHIIDVDYAIDGYGYVKSQSIAKGKKVNVEEKISIVLADKYDMNKQDS